MLNGSVAPPRGGWQADAGPRSFPGPGLDRPFSLRAGRRLILPCRHVRFLADKLQAVFKNLRGYGKLTEKNVADALREVRLALLEADVNYKVAKDFIERTKQRALGQEVLASVTPGQQIVKIVHDELVALMGGDPRTRADVYQLPGRFTQRATG